MDKISHTFGKEHRLSSRTLINRLFAEGHSFFAYPFRCVWMVGELTSLRKAEQEQVQVQVLVSVSKRNHKKAVARNLLKRRAKEAYRLNRHLLSDIPLKENERLIFALIYTSKDILEYSTIAHGVLKSISEIQKRLSSDRDISVCTPNQDL